MKAHIAAILAVTSFLVILPSKAEEADRLSKEESPVSEALQIKEEIKKQELLLQVLKDRLAALESNEQREEVFIIDMVGGKLMLKGVEFSPQEVELALKQKAEISTTYPILVRAEEATPRESVIEMFDLCRKVGFSSIAFATSKE